MIKIYNNSSSESKLTSIKEFKPKSWVCVTDPRPEELKRLSKQLGVSKDLLHDTIDQGELPRLEMENNCLVIIVRAPKYRENDKIDVIPITVILSEYFITTITIDQSSVIEDLKDGEEPVVTAQQSSFMVKLLLRVVQQYQRHISSINRTVQSNKARLNDVQKADVLRLMETEELLNNFITSLEPTINTIKKVVMHQRIPFNQQDREIVDDLLIDAQQVLQFCVTNLKTIRNVRDSYTTVMTLRLNQIVQVLTYITAFLTIPMLVSSIYGMNISLPLADSPFAFGMLAGITIALIVVANLFFWNIRRKF